jgi:hypothetical protein
MNQQLKRLEDMIEHLEERFAKLQGQDAESDADMHRQCELLSRAIQGVWG